MRIISSFFGFIFLLMLFFIGIGAGGHLFYSKWQQMAVRLEQEITEKNEIEKELAYFKKEAERTTEELNQHKLALKDTQRKMEGLKNENNSLINKVNEQHDSISFIVNRNNELQSQHDALKEDYELLALNFEDNEHQLKVAMAENSELGLTVSNLRDTIDLIRFVNNKVSKTSKKQATADLILIPFFIFLALLLLTTSRKIVSVS